MTQVVGVDIGGTKTRIVVASADGADADADAASQELLVPSSTWRKRLGDFAGDAVALRDLLIDGFGPGILESAVAVGAHGCENSEQCLAFQTELSAVLEGPVLVVNDSELIAPAMGDEGAIGVVVGTGSIATVRDTAGELVTAGGWGWLLGDEGSAPGLVREATRAVLDDLDGGGAIDPLGRRLMAAFGAAGGDELALAVTDSAAAETWGAHAPEVFAAADEGSRLAITVIDDAADSLAWLVERLLDRGIPADGVVAGGSVIERQPRLQEAFRSALARTHPILPVAILDRPPVLGAVALARRLVRTSATHPLTIGDIQP
ncbi:N-acetylglucosamine kinase [Leifsonia sp. SIMBA_070]|uniref:N-acetylglucosamine kinase n=1 Tax=Leifsonia sp. SIMBA_070 TaxID=3085810 RepID=UPI00397C1AFB